MSEDIVRRLRWWGEDGVAGDRAMLVEAAAEIVALREQLAKARGEVARARKELSDMATKYSWAVDTFNTGFSGYEAVLLYQRRYAEEGHPSTWRGSMKKFAERSAAGQHKGEQS